MSDKSLEVRIPISPRADYFNRIRIIALSIREFYPDATIRVTIGSEAPPRDLSVELPWSRRLGVQWHWISASSFLQWKDTEHPYIATMMERFQPPFCAKYVLMLDADVIAVRAFDELFEKPDALKAVMAHVSPFRVRGVPDAHVSCWNQLYRDYGLAPPVFKYEVSGWRAMEADPVQRYSPAYFNTGVLFARAELLDRLHEGYMNALTFVRRNMDSYFFEQIALTLAIDALRIPVDVLPLRYNYPNQVEFDTLHPSELGDIRLLHFLRTQVVSRERDFETESATQMLASRKDLRGSNEILRRRVAALMEHVAS